MGSSAGSNPCPSIRSDACAYPGRLALFLITAYVLTIFVNMGQANAAGMLTEGLVSLPAQSHCTPRGQPDSVSGAALIDGDRPIPNCTGRL